MGLGVEDVGFGIDSLFNKSPSRLKIDVLPLASHHRKTSYTGLSDNPGT